MCDLKSTNRMTSGFLTTFEGTDQEIRQLHAWTASDVASLMSFSESFRECAAFERMKTARTKFHLIRHVSSWKSMTIALARILASKPHSADVKRFQNIHL